VKININRILLIFSGLLFLVLFPYSKEIEIFKTDDINWDIINNAKKFKEFDPRIFAFKETIEYSKDILDLNNSNIVIKGFIKKHKHKDHIDLILTENITDVCFMCDHDELSNHININPVEADFYKLKDDSYVKLSGIFKINKNNNRHFAFSISEAKLEDVINLN